MNRRPLDHRSGIVTIAVIVVLTVTTGLCLQLARRATLMYRSVQQQQVRLQCENLAAAGILRAEKAMLESNDYSGEVWELKVGEIHQTNSANVRIKVSDNQIISEASYPANLAFPCMSRQTKRIEQ